MAAKERLNDSGGANAGVERLIDALALAGQGIESDGGITDRQPVHRARLVAVLIHIFSGRRVRRVATLDGGKLVQCDGAIMTAKTQITLGTEMQLRARQRANDLGVSLTEYFRRLVARDLARPETAEIRQYIRDFDRLAGTTTPRELYDKTLELHPQRVNPLPLWLSAHAARP